MAWLAILATVAGLGPPNPGPTRGDRGPSVGLVVSRSDPRPSSIPLDASVVDDRDVEADCDETWMPPVAYLAADRFLWLTWSVAGSSLDHPFECPHGHLSRRIPLRC